MRDLNRMAGKRKRCQKERSSSGLLTRGNFNSEKGKNEWRSRKGGGFGGMWCPRE